MLQIKGFELQTQGKCLVCKKSFPLEMLTSIGKSLYVCTNCARVKEYSTPNTLVYGKGASPLLSVEFEVSHLDGKENSILAFGFLPTSDSSVAREYKSPIYYNWKMFQSHCIHAMGPLAHLVGNDAGTHIHFNCDPDLKRFVQNNWGELYGYLGCYLKSKPSSSRKVFGREMNGYCRHYSENGGDRHIFINPHSRYPTWEFRLPRFVSPQQYYGAAKVAYAILKETERQYKDSLDEFKMVSVAAGAMRCAGSH